MSFNSQRDGILQDEQDKDVAQIERFNSQRDGILPLDKSMSNPDSAFQFPTGWNSTRQSTKLHHEVYGGGFNSQRDGILPK